MVVKTSTLRKEIEDYLLSHPKVNDVVVVPMPDPKMGERACAFVVPKEGEEFSFEAMVRLITDKLKAEGKIK